VSNFDNLSALVGSRIAAWPTAQQAPFALEAVRGTPADRQGGRLARYQGRGDDLPRHDSPPPCLSLHQCAAAGSLRNL
jgi:UDP-N-acetylglucosamine pyrophosphorylase